jgi:acetolactate synthase-1/3 small subunit
MIKPHEQNTHIKQHKMEQKFTLSVFTENHIGLLNRVTNIFTRRHINIESLTVSASEMEGIHRFTVVLRCTAENAAKLVKQLEKLVEVLKAFCHSESETVYQEIALYKIPTESLTLGHGAEGLIRAHNARILSMERDYTVIEKTGHVEETQQLFNELESFGVLEFVRSGRVAITKPMKQLSSYLEEMEHQ